MRCLHAPVWALLAALLSLSPALAQGGGGELPVPPSPAELAALPAEQVLREQTALKAVWLERLIRAREQRHRITRENVAHSVMQAQKLGAPAAFVAMLRRQAMGNLPPRERHALESAQQALLEAYGVDAREMRFFVEGCELSASQLREVFAWLPLQSLFNTPPPAEDQPATAGEASRRYREFLAARQALMLALKGAVDAASADATAEALLPVLERYLPAVYALGALPKEALAQAAQAHAYEASWVNEACKREQTRLLELRWFGSTRLQVLMSLFP